MAIARTPWQRYTPREPWNRLSPNLRLLLDTLTSIVGGQFLGGYTVRPIRGGTSWSTHAFGASFDWRYENTGAAFREVGEHRFLTVVLPWLIDNADALGVQQIHDYKRGRIWRTGIGWRPSTAQHMGQSWAGYIHVETNAHRWADVTPLSLRGIPLLGSTSTTPAPTPTPPKGPTMHTVSFSTPMLSIRTPRTPALRTAVRTWQGILNNRAGQSITVDGFYGPQTADAARRVQSSLKITADGVIGPQTMRALLAHV